MTASTEGLKGFFTYKKLSMITCVGSNKINNLQIFGISNIISDHQFFYEFDSFMELICELHAISETLDFIKDYHVGEINKILIKHKKHHQIDLEFRTYLLTNQLIEKYKQTLELRIKVESASNIPPETESTHNFSNESSSTSLPNIDTQLSPKSDLKSHGYQDSIGIIAIQKESDDTPSLPKSLSPEAKIEEVPISSNEPSSQEQKIAKDQENPREIFEKFLLEKKSVVFQAKPIIETHKDTLTRNNLPFPSSNWNSFIKAIQSYTENPRTSQARTVNKLIQVLSHELKDCPEFDYNVGYFHLIARSRKEAIKFFEAAYQKGRLIQALFNIGFAYHQLPKKTNGYPALFYYFKSIQPSDDKPGWFIFLDIADSEQNYCLVFDIIKYYSSEYSKIHQIEPSNATIQLLLDTVLLIYDIRNEKEKFEIFLQKRNNTEVSRKTLNEELNSLGETLSADIKSRKKIYGEYISAIHTRKQENIEHLKKTPKGYIINFWGYPRPLQGIIEDQSGKRYFYRISDVIDPDLHEKLENFDPKVRIPVDFDVRPAPPGKLYEIAFGLQLHQKHSLEKADYSLSVKPSLKQVAIRGEAIPDSQIAEEMLIIPEAEEDRKFSDFSLFFLDKCKFGQIPPSKIKRSPDGKGIFIGSNEDALTHINQLDTLAKSSGRGTKTPLARADDLLTAAKIAYDAELKTEKIYYYLYRSLNSWGDYYLSDENVPLEPALACYFETLYVFDSMGKNTDFKIEEPRYALLKYLNGILGKRLPLQQAHTLSQDDILDEFFSVLEPDLDVRFDHAIILSKHSRLSKKVITNYIFKNKTVLKKSLEFINRRSGINRPSTIKIEDFTQLWDSIKNSKNDPYKKLVQGFLELRSFTLSILNTEKAMDLLEKNAGGLVFKIDQTRLHDIKKIFLSLKKSLEESSFEERDNFLRQSSIDITNLSNGITEFPTQFSVEKILPLLDHLRDIVDEELQRLYSTATPQISIRLRAEDESFVPIQGRVNVKITIENAKYCSPVESLELFVEKSTSNAYSSLTPSRKIQRSIHGGQIETADIELNVSETAIKARTFTLGIHGKYSSRTVNNQTTTAVIPVTHLPIRLYSKEEFKKIINPYAAWADSQAVKDSSMFFGRDDLIDTVVNTISQTTQSKGFVIYGQRRSGKSSILYHICRRLKEDPNNLVVNIHSIGGALSEDSQRFGLLEKILWNILKELKISYDNTIKKHHLAPFDIDFPNYEKFSNDPSPLMLFQETMDAFLLKIRGIPEWKNCRIIVLIDEFSYIYEWILEGKLSGSIMKNFKSFLQKDYFKIIIAGQDIMPEFMNMFSNDFAVFQPERVTYLLPVYARQLIEDPLRIGGPRGNTRYLENSVEEILDLTACNPYYIQIFCNRLVELMNREYSIYVTRVEVEKVKEELISGQNSLSLDKFENLYNSGDKVSGQRAIDDNLSVLYQIAIHSEQGPCHVSKITYKTFKDITAILDDLVNRDVLTREEGDYYRIKVGLFKDWLKKNYSPKSISVDKIANPFSQYGAPVTGDEFIGRTQYLEVMENRIINVTHPGNLAIIGLPRIGKTSLVKEFLRRNSDYLVHNKRIPIFIDISQYHTTDDFFMGLVENASRANSGIDSPKFASIVEQIKGTTDTFERNSLINDFYAQYSLLGYNVIYFLDEFDILCRTCRDSTILQTLRNLISSDYGVKIVTISRRTLSEIEKNIAPGDHAGSTFAGVFQDLFVGEFNEEDMSEFYKKLSEYDVSLTDTDKNFIIEQCGAFPLYISGVGFHLIDQKKRNGMIDVSTAVNEIKIAMMQNFRHIVDLLNESESYDALNTLLFTENKIPQMKIHELEKYGLIRQNYNAYTCSSKLFFEFLKENLDSAEVTEKLVDDGFEKILNAEEELPNVEYKTSALWSLNLSEDEISRRIQEGELTGEYNTSCLKTFGKDCSRFIIAKTLAAFLNTDGGDLMIGVNENRSAEGTIYNKLGIDRDLQILEKIKGDNSIDSYRRFITKDIIEPYFDLKITNHFSKYFNITTKKIGNKWFCRINVIKSDQAIVLRYNRQDYFFVRKDTTIKQLNMTQAAEYIHTHDWATVANK